MDIPEKSVVSAHSVLRRARIILHVSYHDYSKRQRLYNQRREAPSKGTRTSRRSGATLTVFIFLDANGRRLHGEKSKSTRQRQAKRHLCDCKILHLAQTIKPDGRREGRLHGSMECHLWRPSWPKSSSLEACGVVTTRIHESR